MRVGEAVPHGRWRTVTVVSAIGPAGVAGTLASEGACGGPAFAAFAERVLAPALRPGDVVVADNLSIATLRRFKDDATEVREGFECGISLGSYNDINVDDVIETFELREKPRV